MTERITCERADFAVFHHAFNISVSCTKSVIPLNCLERKIALPLCMKVAQIAQSRSASSSVAPRRTELLALAGPRNKNIVFPISPAFPYTCKHLLPQLFSFDTHANSPGVGVPICRLQVGAVLLLPSLFCRARQLISLFLNSFRTLCQNTRGVPPSAIAPQLASFCLSFATLLPLAVPCMRQLFSCLLIPTDRKSVV